MKVLSFNIIFLTFIYVIVCIRSIFISIIESHSVVIMYQSLSVFLLVFELFSCHGYYKSGCYKHCCLSLLVDAYFYFSLENTSGIHGFEIKCTFDFIRKYQMFIQSGLLFCTLSNNI